MNIREQSARIINVLMILTISAFAAWPATVKAHDKGDILLVNKSHSLSESYVPGNLVYPDVAYSGDRERMRSYAADALENMFYAAKQDGIQLYAASGYRSYDYQEDLHQYWVNQYGEEEANRISAKAGESEHQTGLVMDVTSSAVNFELVKAFGDTRAGQWIEQNAASYGFIVRYPQGKEHVTGYSYEPWHLRYVGIDHAREIMGQNMTLETYLSTSQDSDSSTAYRIKPGDTLYKIALEHDTSIDRLMGLNPSIEPRYLQIGATIQLPGSTTAPTNPSKSYTIQPGDTFSGIAASYHDVTTQELIDANPGISPRYLVIGSTITIPGSSESDSQTSYVESKGNVWIHATPDFNASSRVGVFYEGEKEKLLGETNNMYQISSGYVSKHYADIIK
ncbi:LD-carboxypeptidase LdcB, LAS superfamily [Thalassobacillus cyri]|uniref:LD-carboxypeptidase LdcB, LAS superfamily n=1 Tax=Thalassobacillus cyri TaxID=571932 RepID=A0A1H3Z2T5_9BACI|nr:D-alanyl-D-alanine carboxypeptidase family protein [Thalassobacillus cyri]SEA17970.1 LD-carboxypeptidase LdcB, LAS superfamily [Thalassobacillus cyri]